MARFDPAQYERESDEIMSGVMPTSWDGHQRLEEDNYPYRQWSDTDDSGGFVFGEVE